ncbi:MAG: hypothetical protein KKD56_09400 [Acidobacteria bacterium]|nr:hypothetical protein [Acidobacteriota bacterium]MBU1474709.1 hypothetical protein [Acidobacteriota bacterium]MBU2439175.1 hypothetical protein [Acidobacteriota bacterium]
MRIFKLNGRRNPFLFIAGALCWLSFQAAGQMIDRIAAVVEETVITWSDIRIARDFQLYDLQEVLPSEQDRYILDRMVDQKLILRKMGAEILLPVGEPEKTLISTLRRLGADRSAELLAFFGLTREDLYPYIEEKLLFQKITFERFKDSAFVGLKEMDAYYEEVYLPEREAIGLNPLPLLEILNEIEAAIKETKIKRLVEEWLKTLRAEADVQIFLESTLTGR